MDDKIMNKNLPEVYMVTLPPHDMDTERIEDGHVHEV
jgi:hypothetical protein